MKKYFVILLVALCATNLQAQVTIGSGEDPAAGALLDLKETGTTTKGLGMPRVKLESLSKLKMGDNEITDTDNAHKKHTGLIVYNVYDRSVTNSGETCPGLHVWDGDKWQPLSPYTEPKVDRVQVGGITRGFEYLDPDSPTGWPADKEADRAAGKYALGNSQTATVKDIENNVYNTSRFYVGYMTKIKTYTVRRSYNCDPTAMPNWVNEGTETETDKTFADGVWTTENLRTTKFADGTNITKSAANSNTNPQYWIPGNKGSVTRAEGLLYNWAAAINMGTGTGQTPDPGNVDQGGGSNDDVLIQGICPQGWHLPSDQEYTDLENGVILKTQSFSDEPNDIGGSLLTYDARSWRGTTHGQAMKSKTAVDGKASNGSSKTNAVGGFDTPLAGIAGGGSLLLYYGYDAYVWTGSSLRGAKSWARALNYADSQVYRCDPMRADLFSVRCKKD